MATEKSSKHRKIILIVCGVLLLLSVIAGGTVLLLQQRSVSPFNETISSSVNFPLYYSKELPEGYQLDEDSVSFNKGVVVYSISSKDGNKKLFVSQQKRPEGFDFEGFNTDKISEAYEIQTPNGTATIGVVNDTTQVISVVSGETWIFANTPDDMPSADIEAVARGLIRINP